MDKIITIDKLLPGQSARVLRLNTKGGMRRRFIDLGLIEGTVIRCVGKSPLGDPSAYLIRGAVIAIRSSDAVTVEAEPIIVND